MHTETQFKIQHLLAIFNQQVGVTGLSITHVGQAQLMLLHPFQYGRLTIDIHCYRRCRAQIMNDARLGALEGLRGCITDGNEFNGIAGFKLAHLPQLSLHNGDRTDKAAETWSIGSENHRHVTGEIHRTNGIGIVVNIGRMQTCLATIATRPLWLGANQAHAGATGVVMHLPVRVEEGIDIDFSKKIWRAMRSVHHRNFPM